MPIQPADPEFRRRTLLLLVLTVAAGLAGLFLLRQWLADLGSRPPSDALLGLLIALRWFALSMGTLLAGLAIYLWRLARRVSDEQRFPASNQRLVRDTPVFEGTAALHRARMLRVFAVSLILSSLGLLIVVWRLTSTFGASLAK